MGDEKKQETSNDDPRDLEIQELKEQLEKLTKQKDEPPKDDPDLIEKARIEREAKDKQGSDSKALEAALKFSMNSDSWLKQNESILPSDIKDIFEAAGKENYANAIEKDAALKSGIIQSFFKVQENIDILTPSQKNQLDDYLKLTKTGKEEKAQSLYDSIFEPTFEMLKRLKKAEALSKGFKSGNHSEDAYRDKLISLSKKHYLGDK